MVQSLGRTDVIKLADFYTPGAVVVLRAASLILQPEPVDIGVDLQRCPHRPLLRLDHLPHHLLRRPSRVRTSAVTRLKLL